MIWTQTYAPVGGSVGLSALVAALPVVIGNTAPVAFGGLGLPLVILAPLTGLDLLQLSAMVGRQLPFFSLLVPFWLVAAQVGWRGMVEVWPACLVSGASFGAMQFLMSNFHGPWLVDIVSASVALTGSDTSSNVLFGNLQKVSAQQLGFSPILMCAANSTGGVMGKMIDAQSIVVASVATGGHPESPAVGTILRAVFWHSIALALLVGVHVMLQAYVWPGVVPK